MRERARVRARDNIGEGTAGSEEDRCRDWVCRENITVKKLKKKTNNQSK